MNPQADILQRLHELSDDDRAWIVARLPTPAKARLLATVPSATARDRGASAKQSARPRIPREPAASDTVSLDLLAHADAQALASTLQHEPAWVTAALLKARDWPWSVELLEALSPTLRLQVISAQNTGCPCTPLLATTLARLLAARVGRTGPQRAPSTFEAMLERLRASRTKKRTSLHL